MKIIDALTKDFEDRKNGTIKILEAIKNEPISTKEHETQFKTQKAKNEMIIRQEEFLYCCNLILDTIEYYKKKENRKFRREK